MQKKQKTKQNWTERKWKSTSLPFQRKACTRTAEVLIDHDERSRQQNVFETVIG